VLSILLRSASLRLAGFPRVTRSAGETPAVRLSPAGCHPTNVRGRQGLRIGGGVDFIRTGEGVTLESHMDNGVSPSPAFPFPLPRKSVGE